MTLLLSIALCVLYQLSFALGLPPAPSFVTEVALDQIDNRLYTSPFYKRQAGEPTTLKQYCYAKGDPDGPVSYIANTLADYLNGVSDRGQRCGIDRSQPYSTLVSAVQGDKVWEVNLVFTSAVPQIQSSQYDCRYLADILRALVQTCKSKINNDDPVLVWQEVPNCADLQPVFSGAPPQPYVEGGTGLEFRLKSFKSPIHPDKSTKRIDSDSIDIILDT